MMARHNMRNGGPGPGSGPPNFPGNMPSQMNQQVNCPVIIIVVIIIIISHYLSIMPGQLDKKLADIYNFVELRVKPFQF